MADADPRAFPLRGRRVVLGVAGGIAAYKAAELVRLLVTESAEVRVVMTEAAQKFIAPLTFQTLSGRPVATDLFDLGQESQIGHIHLAEQADLLVIAPATADLIARMACGMGDDLLTTVALATRAPLLLAPAMNTNMWENPLVKGNLRRLVGLGRVHIVGPEAGFLACKTVGPGRLADPQDILEAAARVLCPHDLDGKRLLVTAGPTHEALDPVRFVANRSSGKMGYALARAAYVRGAQVTLVSGPTSLSPPVGVDFVSVRTAREMHDATTQHAVDKDAVVMAAAVADFRPARFAESKLKKEDLGAAPTLVLERNPDVLLELGRARQADARRRPILVGFAAETVEVVAHARAKLVAKGCDLVVANDVSAPDAGFEVDTNRVVLVGPGDEVLRLPLATKDVVAHQILDRVLPLLEG